MAGLEPILERLLQRYESDEKKGDVSLRGMVAHNAATLISIHGGAAMMLEAPLKFDPRLDYWRVPPRRFLVTYGQKMWKGRFFAPAALRSVLLDLHRGMEAWAARTGLDFGGVDRYGEHPWADLVDRLIGGARELPSSPQWAEVVAKTKGMNLPSTASEHFVEYLRTVRTAELKESGLLGRLAFFPYCGALDLPALERNQRFWFGFAHTFTTPNAYRTAGAQYFAPMLQNTATTVFVDALRGWRKGEIPTVAGLRLQGNEDAQREASDKSVIVELWTFLNLHRAPIYNNLAESAYDGLAGSIATHGKYSLVQGVGDLTRAWLASHDVARAALAALAKRLVAGGYPTVPPFALEHRLRHRLKLAESVDELYAEDSVDLQLRKDVERLAIDTLGRREELDQAAIALHLLLDADTYLKSLGEPSDVESGDDDEDDDVIEPPAGRVDAVALQSALGARRVWLYSPGRQARFWPSDRREGLASIGWDELPDLSGFGSKDELWDGFLETYGDKNSPHSVGACWNFSHEVAVGDTIVAKKGRRSFIGIGRVREPYRFDPARPRHRHLVGVDWLWSGQHQLDDVTLPLKTLTDVTRATEIRREIERLIAAVAPGAAPVVSEAEEEEARPFSVDDAAKGLFLERARLVLALDLLRRKKNLILQGPPGVGKTFTAKRLAYALMEEEDPDRLAFVQFHQAYTYEAFIQGFVPDSEGRFRLRSGPFLDFVGRARAQLDEPHVMIIDEINRGNLGKILGELMMLIEPDKRSESWAVRLPNANPDDPPFYVPPNLHIIGTMNTADRSLALVDYALRRRFVFFDLAPAVEEPGFRSFLTERRVPTEVTDRIVRLVTDLNGQIEADPQLGSGFRIGHSFFCDYAEGDPTKWLDDVLRFELLPLLQEYWFDAPASLESARRALGIEA